MNHADRLDTLLRRMNAVNAQAYVEGLRSVEVTETMEWAAEILAILKQPSCRQTDQPGRSVW